MATPPPPRKEQQDTIPDYYLGFLLYYDELGTDRCKWVVYDGAARVRCPTRKAALDYITDRYNTIHESDISSRIIDARIALNHAIEQLDAAARFFVGVERLQLERLAVRLKPVLVDIDNIILT